MKREITLIVLALILGGSLLGSSWILAEGMREKKQLEGNHEANPSHRVLLTSKEAALYLGIPQEEFEELVDRQVKEKAGLSSYEIYRYIPYMRIGRDKYFSVPELNKWVEYSIHNVNGHNPG